MAFQIPNHITWKNLDSGIVLLNLDSSNYYTLNSTASDIWRAIMDGKEVADIAKEIQSKYDCDASECMSDIDEQLVFLKEEGLIIEDL